MGETIAKQLESAEANLAKGLGQQKEVELTTSKVAIRVVKKSEEELRSDAKKPLLGTTVDVPKLDERALTQNLTVTVRKHK